MRSVPMVTILVLALASAPASADKLDDFGLDPGGHPWPEKDSGPEWSIVLGHDQRLVRVARPDLAQIDDPCARARAIIEAVLEGDRGDQAVSVASPFPTGSRLDQLDCDGSRLTARIEIPEGFLHEPARVEGQGEAMQRALQMSLDEYQSFAMLVRTPGDREWRSLQDYLPPDRHRIYSPSADDASPAGPTATRKTYPRLGSGRPTGALSGKDVYLNPGHGWVFRDSTSDYWGVQRGFVYNNIEDFSNVDLVNQWLAAYCYNAGADVFSVREFDQQTNMVIVDNDDGAPTYSESGSGWINSSLAGFANGHAPYVDGDDPFSFGSNRLVRCVEGAPTASATWTAEIPENGWYRVSVSHAAYTNRSPVAHYEIRHAGGSTDAFIDQRQRRFTWIPLGEYFFEAGAPTSERQVVLFNDSSSATHYVSADAVRFGGGMGLISRGTAGTSGKPRFDEEARYAIQFSGAPDYNGTGTDEQDGWPRRPRFARWLKQGAEAYGAPARDSVFISSHTNAGGGNGISSFVYPDYENSWHDRLRWAVHDEVVNDLNFGYPGSFTNRGYKYGTYSENNPSNVSDLMPIFLGEWLFHDSAADMAKYHDPKFRRSLARAIYQGIVKFWATENGDSAVLLPEPPERLRAVQLTPTSVEISWQAPPTDGNGVLGDAATGYRLYRGSHGRAFSAGNDVGSATSIILEDLVPGKTEYLYVTATNAGGESFPTEVLAVRSNTSASDPRVLIISGFDKMDPSTRVRDTWNGDTLYRQLMRRMNTVDSIVEHAQALTEAAPTLAFDSCEDEVLSAGEIALADYQAVLWIGGLQSEVWADDGRDDTSIDSAQQAALAAYHDGGGNIFISGSEIAWDLDRGGGTSFVDTVLHADYLQDDSGLATVSGSPASIFEGLGPMSFGPQSSAGYAVHYPEVLAAGAGASSALEYGGGTMVEDFDDLAGWWDPNTSGQTNADPASSFTTASSTIYEGVASGDLYYVWGSGDFIREYNSDLTPVATDAVLSMWIHGDGQGHQLRLCLRDATDSDLFVSNPITIDFSGWQQFSWNLSSDPVNVWVQNGNGLLDGSAAGLDSIQILREVSGASSGHLYFDQLVDLGGSSSGMTAAVQYAGVARVVFLGIPFETIVGAAQRQQLMAAVVDFFGLGDLIFTDGFETGGTTTWSASVP